MRNRTLALVTLGMLAGPMAAHAITNGEMDGEGHPYVGIMVGKIDGIPYWRCSGTLISPTLFLTAGHCTDGATSVEVWFDPDMQTDSAAKGYPFTGEASGVPHTHPQYNPNAFAAYDLGIVVLDQRVDMSEYGALPTLDQLDALKKRRGLQDVTFTAVGYGLQQSFPTAQAYKNKEANVKIRMVAYPSLLQINGGIVGYGSLLLSNSANTGGTCFGDSGGPNFIDGTSVIAGVTSFGLNGTCSGTGGVYRVDRQDDLDWIATFMP
jgi:secreted trypsin-like serine protease